jgi:hypothetical protein
MLTPATCCAREKPKMEGAEEGTTTGSGGTAWSGSSWEVADDDGVDEEAETVAEGAPSKVGGAVMAEAEGSLKSDTM